MYISNLGLLVFVLFSSEIHCECRHSYMTFCDDLDDFSKYKITNWTEIVVGKEDDDSSRLHIVDYKKIDIGVLNRLRSLIIVRQIKEIKMFTFTASFRESKLDNLILYGNEIKRLKFTTFDSLTLRKLSLVNNSIEYIHKGLFYNCYIQVIDLSHNKLEMIEFDIFNDEYLKNNTTKELILRHNRIESIQSNSLPNSLEILNLDYNNLEELDYEIFDNLVNLRELTLSHNKIQSPPGFTQLTKIGVIDLSYNLISTLNVTEFTNLTDLLVLDLSHNEISYPLTFNKLNFPKRYHPLQISLAFNKLTHLIIEDDSFGNHVVILYGNPWDCRCLAMLEKFMKDHEVKRNACDLKHFGTGQVPYCIGYECNDCSKAVDRPEDTSGDIDKFLEVLKQTENQVGCNLSPYWR